MEKCSYDIVPCLFLSVNENVAKHHAIYSPDTHSQNYPVVYVIDPGYGLWHMIPRTCFLRSTQGLDL